MAVKEYTWYNVVNYICAIFPPYTLLCGLFTMSNKNIIPNNAKLSTVRLFGAAEERLSDPKWEAHTQAHAHTHTRTLTHTHTHAHARTHACACVPCRACVHACYAPVLACTVARSRWVRCARSHVLAARVFVRPARPWASLAHSYS